MGKSIVGTERTSSSEGLHEILIKQGWSRYSLSILGTPEYARDVVNAGMDLAAGNITDLRVERLSEVIDVRSYPPGEKLSKGVSFEDGRVIYVRPAKDNVEEGTTLVSLMTHSGFFINLVGGPCLKRSYGVHKA